MSNVLHDLNIRDFSKLGKSNVVSSNAMLACSHPIALSIGLEILKNNGNAVDAALAMNAVLCVAEPHMTGVGGDCFAMISVDGSTDIKALNGSGKSSENAKGSNLRKKNITSISPGSSDAITIPGAVAGWCLLHKEHGNMPWKELFDPAIEFANQGIRVHERVALDWSNNINKSSLDTDTSNIFLKNGSAFKFTDNFKNENLAETFRTIAEEGYNGFYNGWVADDMVSKLNEIGGNQTHVDFRNAEAEWVENVSGNYRGFTIHECPPNGQGIVALIILGILERFKFDRISEVDYIHIFCEATKIGYFLRDQYLADPDTNRLSVDQFLNSKILDQYASSIDMNKAKTYDNNNGLFVTATSSRSNNNIYNNNA